MYKHITEQTAIIASVFKWVFLSAFVGLMIAGVITDLLNT